MRPLHVLLSLATAFTLSAQEASPVKIAVFLPNQVINSSVRGHKLFSELEVMKKNLDEKVQAKAQEGQKLQAQLQSPSLSESGKELLTKQMRDLEYEFKKLQEDSEADYRKVYQRVTTQFQNEIFPLIQELAKEQKLQLVITEQQGLIAYADPSWIQGFTGEVIKRYDAKFESATPAPAPAKPAAPKAPVKSTKN